MASTPNEPAPHAPAPPAAPTPAPGPTPPSPETAAARNAIAPGTSPVSAGTVDARIVAAGFDPLPVAATPDAIRTELRTSGNPVVLDGDVRGANGKAERGWTSVEGIDPKTGDFITRAAGATATSELSPKGLEAFAGTRRGGDAIEIDARPAGAASQREIDAIVAAVPKAQQANARESVPLLLDAAQRAGITNDRQVAYILATAERESHFGGVMVEDGNGKGADGIDHYFDRYEPGTKQGKLLGNTEKGDGERFKGRGYVQVTGRAHAATFSEKLGMPDAIVGGKSVPYFVDHPQELARPDIAAQTMVTGMRDGTFSGRALDRYVDAKKTDYVGARHVVNGTDHADEIARSAERYQHAIEGRTQPHGGRLDAPDAKSAIDRAIHDGANLPPLRRLSQWGGEQREGSVVRIDENTMAMHVGRGSYVSLDVSRDLGGRAPETGTMIALKAPGDARELERGNAQTSGRS